MQVINDESVLEAKHGLLTRMITCGFSICLGHFLTVLWLTVLPKEMKLQANISLTDIGITSAFSP
jgi:hypothetical protein